jgi:hypothetical protein
LRHKRGFAASSMHFYGPKSVVLNDVGAIFYVGNLQSENTLNAAVHDVGGRDKFKLEDAS